MTDCTQNCPRDGVASPLGMTAAALQLLHHWLQARRLKVALRRERAQLLSMTAAQLQDIGVDRDAASREAKRRDIPEVRIR